MTFVVLADASTSPVLSDLVKDGGPIAVILTLMTFLAILVWRSIIAPERKQDREDRQREREFRVKEMEQVAMIEQARTATASSLERACHTALQTVEAGSRMVQHLERLKG